MRATRRGDGGSEALRWAFVGREAELAEIAEARRTQGSPGIVLMAAAGVGKSELARRAVQGAERDGALTYWVQATRSAASVPLGAFAGLISPGPGAEDTLALMRACAESFRARAGGRAIVVAVDDAQLLDPASAALVLHLAVDRVAFVLATVREGEPRPDAVEALWKDLGLPRLGMATLDRPETDRLVDAVLGPSEERVRRWAYARSDGNLLYLRELLIGAMADGALDGRDDFWRLTREPEPSTSLRELIGGRLEDIADEERAALDFLAIGEPLPLEELVELAGVQPVNALETRGLVRADEGVMRLAHPLYGEVVRATMPTLRAREACLRLAALVQRRPERTSGEQLRVARWLLDAGAEVPAGVAVEAADAANLAGDADLGAQLAQAALKGEEGARAALALARSHSMRQRFAEAEAVLAAAEDRFTDGDLAMRALEHRVVLLQWLLRRDDEALAFIERMTARWPDPSRRAQVEAMRLYLVMWQEPGETIERADALLAAGGLEPEVRRRVELVRAGALFYAGRGREAYTHAQSVRPALPLRGTHEQVALDLCALIDCETGEDLPGTERWLEEALLAAVGVRDDAAAGLAALTLADLQRATGQLVSAQRWVAEAIGHLERRDPFRYLSLAYMIQTGIAYERGDFDGAAVAFDRHRATADAEYSLPELPCRARALAWRELAGGNPGGAQTVLLEAADSCVSMPVYEVSLRYEAMRAGAPAASLADAMERAAARCDARLGQLYAAHVRALATRDGRTLLAVAEDLATAGSNRYASECAAHAAEVFAEEGRDDSARRAAQRSRELHARGQGGTAPTLRGLDSRMGILTRREAQFVELAARGMTNAEIADRLTVSVRTVESHLYRAMQKLGVRARRDLPRTQSG